MRSAVFDRRTTLVTGELERFVRSCSGSSDVFATVVRRKDTNGRRSSAVREPCPRDGGHILKALITGVCALLLLVLPAAAESQTDTQLNVQLRHHLQVMKKDQQVLRFLNRHRWLLSDPRFAANARHQLRVHTASLAAMKKAAAVAETALAKRAKARHLAALRAATPRVAICNVFGKYCAEALQVSRCESGLTTTAQNGQYLGLFQMGSSARQLYGHGTSAIAQARAAHRYFVASGHEWGPWSCKPWS